MTRKCEWHVCPARFGHGNAAARTYLITPYPPQYIPTLRISLQLTITVTIKVSSESAIDEQLLSSTPFIHSPLPGAKDKCSQIGQQRGSNTMERLLAPKVL
jgi:hypothetical protein